MAGKIYVRHESGKMTELTQKHYETEDFFQTLIEEYPTILAGDQINPEQPRKWLLISREMGIPAEQGGSAQWSLDHLFIDQDAIPTFIEVKRSTDSRIRREVVGQMLDYAANASQYWSVEALREIYEKNTDEESALTLEPLGITPDKIEDFWKTVDFNLRAGRIRLLFVADEIPSSLQVVIEFLNRQMGDVEVLGVEIKQYISGDGLTTLVPNVLGKIAGEKKPRSKSGSGKWDEESFIAQTIEVSGEDVANVCQNLIKKFESFGCRIWWGQGIGSSFATMYDKAQSHYLFYIYNGSKNTFLQVYFKEMKPGLDTAQQKTKLKTALERIPEVRIPEDRLDKYPSFPVKILSDETSFDLFVDSMKSYIDDIDLHEVNV